VISLVLVAETQRATEACLLTETRVHAQRDSSDFCRRRAL